MSRTRSVRDAWPNEIGEPTPNTISTSTTKASDQDQSIFRLQDTLRARLEDSRHSTKLFSLFFAQNVFSASADMPTTGASSCTEAIQEIEWMCSSILLLGHPEQHRRLRILRANMLRDSRVSAFVGRWPSVFAGITWVINRITPPHRDGKGAVGGYDLLQSMGHSVGSVLKLPDIGATFKYGRGCAVLLAGRALQHTVGGWESGDRICVARWAQDRELQSIAPVLPWSTIQSVVSAMQSH